MSDPRRAVRYAYLNREPAWAGFDLTGLERRPDGSLGLARVPAVVGAVGTAPTTPASSAVAGPAGVASACGEWYATDPERHRIGRFNACLARPESLPCAAGPGPWPGQLDTPRGLAILPSPAGPTIAVAEERNHRVQVFDLASGQSLFVVGKTGPDGRPVPGSDPGEFRGPMGLAADAAGDLYVADRGNVRVQRLGPRGAPVAAFTATLTGPIAVAVAGPAGGVRLYVLDLAEEAGRVVVFDPTDPTTPLASFAVAEVAAPTALAVAGGSIHVGSLDGTVARYDDAGRFVGRSAAVLDDGGQPRPVRALAVERSGDLLAGPGGWPLTRLDPAGGSVRSGHFRVGPVAVFVNPLAWHRWRVAADPLAGAAGIQLFTRVAPAGSAPPAAGTEDDPFPASAGWSAPPRGLLDVAVLDDDARALLAGGPTPGGDDIDPDDPPRDAWVWLAGRLEGDGTASPVLRQMRIDVAPGSSIRHLPEVYRVGSIQSPGPGATDAAIDRAWRASLRSRLLLDLWLAAIDGELGKTAEALDDLRRRIDPAAAPAAGLPWLASWLEFDWDEAWPEADARRLLAGAFALGAARGTAEGLRRYLKIYAGVDAWVEEPAALNGGAPLVLGVASTLGFDAVLAPAPAYGAVLASTATLDHSHLLDPADGGTPLFGDVAHRFCVQVHAAQAAAPGALAALTAILAREAPAHAAYHVCVLPPRMRVGLQARLGIDTVVGGPTPDLNLPAAGVTPMATLGVDAVLADRPHRSNRLGEGARVGGTLGPRLQGSELL